MSLTGVTDVLTAAERAREPRHLGVVAWFAGYDQGSYGRPSSLTFPRRLTRDEERDWRAGFTEGRCERVCHSWHGFVPHQQVGEHPLTVCPEPFPPLIPWRKP